jgi:hypothetical protein
MRRRRSFFAIFVLCLGLPAVAGADGTLTAATGPGNAITFTGPDGRAVSHLDPGTYTVNVDDTSNRRDFTLRGPGVSEHTGFEPTGDHTWAVALKDGWYRFYDAAFEPDFHGEFSVGSPPPVTLKGHVDDAAIAFTKADGSPVTHLDPGTYSIAVEDTSERNNFRLIGPGAEEHTQVVRPSAYTWTLTLSDGTYSFYSERHPELHGTFTVGSIAQARQRFLHGIVGPDFAITLVDDNWQPLAKAIDRGAYTIDIIDGGNDHDFHLSGPGVNKSTGPDLAFVGAQTWNVTLNGGFFRFFCDPHDIMVGDFSVKTPPVKAKPKKKPKPKAKKKKKKRT